MENSIRKEFLFRVITPILAIVILVSGLELFARLYLTAFGIPKTEYDFRKSQPAPYKNTKYFSQKFIWESFHQPSRWIYPKGTRLIIPGDYKGTYFNVKNGQRVTTSQPVNFKNTVYLFGGSTVYNSEVPDNLTIASQLQSLFNSYYKERFIVQNYGTTTVTITQQLERLRTVSIKPNDIVVFYDGVNDIYQSLFYANTKETMVEMNRRVLKEMDFVHRVQLEIYNMWATQSSFVQIFFDPTKRSFPAHLNDPTLVNELLISLKGRYKKAIQDSVDLTSKSHANFYHFLQPHLFADEVLSPYEKKLVQNYYIIPKGIKQSFDTGYPVLKTLIQELPESIHNYDLTNILDERANGSEYFLDACHVNHEADRIIATKIFGCVNRNLSTAND